MKKTSTILMALALAVTVFSTAWIVEDLTTPDMSKHEWTETTHHVREGETLWGIADEYRPADVDRREYIAAVADLNDIDAGMIYAGDNITVLVTK